MGTTPAVLEGLTEAVTKDTGYSVGSPLWGSLHSANPGSSGAHELTSGPYTRQALSFGTAPGGGVDKNNSPVSWNADAGDLAYWWGMWSASSAGTFLGGFPLVSTPLLAMASSHDLATRVLCPGHGLDVGDVVRMFTEPGIPSSAIPNGYLADTKYTVATVPDVDSLTFGITALNSGAFWLGVDLSNLFASPGMYVVPLNNMIYETAS